MRTRLILVLLVSLLIAGVGSPVVMPVEHPEINGK